MPNYGKTGPYFQYAQAIVNSLENLRVPWQHFAVRSDETYGHARGLLQEIERQKVIYW